MRDHPVIACYQSIDAANDEEIDLLLFEAGVVNESTADALESIAGELLEERDSTIESSTLEESDEEGDTCSVDSDLSVRVAVTSGRPSNYTC